MTKRNLVDELKKASAEAQMVWLASDEDREGEAIAMGTWRGS
jgi:DNA topoisomerase-1